MCTDPNANCVSYQPVRPASETCPLLLQAFAKAESPKRQADPRCFPVYGSAPFSGAVIGGPDVLPAAVGHRPGS